MLFTKHFLTAGTMVLLMQGSSFAGELPGIKNRQQGSELTERRGRNTKHFKNNDGTFTMITSAGSLHYRAENGTWLDINTNVTANNSGQLPNYPYVNNENSFKSFFPSALSGNGVITLLGQSKITESRKSGYYFQSTNETSSRYEFKTENAVVNENSVLFKAINKGTDIRYTVLADQRKLDWLLNDRTLVDQAPANALSLVFYESINLPSGWNISQQGDVINAYNEKGEWMVQYEKPFIHEAADPAAGREENEYMTYGSYRLVSINNEWFIETLVDLAWLKLKSRIYPVVIDPTASYYPASTNYWTGYQTSATSKTNGMMRVTTGLNVGWAKFDISSLPSAAIVTQTVMNTYHYSTTGTKDANVNDMNATEPVAAAAATISAAIAANDAYISNYPFGGSSYGWRSGTLGSAANSDIMARRSQGWTAMGFNYASGSTTFMYHYGWNGTYPPYLSITYLDAVINAGVTALLSPLNNECGNATTSIIVKVKNFSAADSVTGLGVVCTISGSINTTITGTLNRKLYAGTEDTIILTPSFNTLTGGNLQFNIYTTYGNDPDHSNDTLNVGRIISAVPSMLNIVAHASSKGTFRSGLLTEPDHAKVGDSMVYELQAPAGYTPGQFGSAWDIAQLSVKTSGLTAMGNFYQGLAGSGNPILILKPQSAEVDSLYKVDITYRIIATGCDSVKTRWCYVAPVPVVDFSLDSVCFGQSTLFLNNTSLLHETPIFHWDFGAQGNADTSDQTNPVYAYGSNGNYNVTLTATSALGYSVSLSKQATVLHKPFTIFNFINACFGDQVSLINQSTIGGSQTTLAYQWDMGDGTFSNATNVSKTYATHGSFQVKLKATSVFGCSDSITKTIRVYERPLVSFTVNNTCAGQATGFTNKTSIGAGMIGYNWDFGDGSSANTASPQKTYTTPGSYDVKLLAISDFGCTDSIITPVAVAATPVASFTTNSFCSNDSVSISNTSSISGGGTLTNEWDFGNGNTLTSSSLLLKQFYLPGTFDIKLKVTSAANCQAEILKKIEVYPNPQANFNTTSPLCEKNDINFVNNSSIQGGSMNYQWSFESAGSSNLQNPVINFTSSGTKNIKLVVVSDRNCLDSVTQNIIIRPTPNADFSLTVLNAQKRQISLEPAITSFYGYEWQMGDGVLIKQVSPVYSYLKNGVFKVTLKVTDMHQCTNTSDTSVMFNVGSPDLNTSDGLTVYPIPANEVLYADRSAANQTTAGFQLIDASGRTIFTGNFTNHLEINTSAMPAGIYLLHITDENQITKKKIIVSH